MDIESFGTLGRGCGKALAHCGISRQLRKCRSQRVDVTNRHEDSGSPIVEHLGRP